MAPTLPSIHPHENAGELAEPVQDPFAVRWRLRVWIACEEWRRAGLLGSHVTSPLRAGWKIASACTSSVGLAGQLSNPSNPCFGCSTVRSLRSRLTSTKLASDRTSLSSSTKAGALQCALTETYGAHIMTFNGIVKRHRVQRHTKLDDALAPILRLFDDDWSSTGPAYTTDMAKAPQLDSTDAYLL